jgi:hypothetical protein
MSARKTRSQVKSAATKTVAAMATKLKICAAVAVLMVWLSVCICVVRQTWLCAREHASHALVLVRLSLPVSIASHRPSSNDQCSRPPEAPARRSQLDMPVCVGVARQARFCARLHAMHAQ